MISDKNPFHSLFTLRNICCGFLLESPRRGDSNKYPRHIFLGILNTIMFNFSNNPFHLELKIRSIQTVVITSFVVMSKVGMKRIDCRIPQDDMSLHISRDGSPRYFFLFMLFIPLDDAVLMYDQNLCFWADIIKVMYLMSYNLANPTFPCLK